MVLLINFRRCTMIIPLLIYNKSLRCAVLGGEAA